VAGTVEGGAHRKASMDDNNSNIFPEERRFRKKVPRFAFFYHHLHIEWVSSHITIAAFINNDLKKHWRLEMMTRVCPGFPLPCRERVQNEG
jgi:hypothetical protein